MGRGLGEDLSSRRWTAARRSTGLCRGGSSSELGICRGQLSSVVRQPLVAGSQRQLIMRFEPLPARQGEMIVRSEHRVRSSLENQCMGSFWPAGQPFWPRAGSNWLRNERSAQRSLRLRFCIGPACDRHRKGEAPARELTLKTYRRPYLYSFRAPRPLQPDSAAIRAPAGEFGFRRACRLEAEHQLRSELRPRRDNKQVRKQPYPRARSTRPRKAARARGGRRRGEPPKTPIKDETNQNEATPAPPVAEQTEAWAQCDARQKWRLLLLTRCG